MNPIDKLKEESSELNYDLNKYLKANCKPNNILEFIDLYKDTERTKRDLKILELSNELYIENNALKMSPSEIDLKDKYMPHFKSGFSIREIALLLKSEIISFEYNYKDLELSTEELLSLKNIVNKYETVYSNNINNISFINLNDIVDSADLLHFTTFPSSKIIHQISSYCLIVFDGNDVPKELNTIFNEDEIKLMEKVNKSICSNYKYNYYNN